jgi:predicted DsbA family dithiol-disulfide isomerase
MEPMPFTVEIWSDVVCPWCYIGKRRFEAALARFPHRDEVEVTYRSFELDPDAPASNPGTGAERLAEKYGVSLEEAQAMNDRVTQIAAEDALEYHLDIARGGNTFDAHRILHLAAAHGVQAPVKERLMRAYFGEGEPISDPETLVRLAASEGVPEDEARTMLAGDRFTAEVRDDELLGAQLGIRGVPFFVLGRRYGVSGAQSADVLLGVLEQAWEEQVSASSRPAQARVGT